MSEIERLVGEAAGRGATLTLSVDELRPQRVLEILAEAGCSHRVRISSSAGSITIELGNGVVVGAEAELAGQALSGKEAYARIGQIADGEVHVAPLRFPSLANILEPVAQLSELTALGPALAGEDTIEVALPQARPFHPPAVSELPTLELALLPEEQTVVELDARCSAPVPFVDDATEVLPPRRRRVARTPVRRAAPGLGRGVALVGAAAALAIGSIGAAWSMTSAEASPEIPAIAPVAASPVPVSTLSTEEVDMDLSQGPTRGPAEARTLARAARASLRAGDAPGALAAARQAATLRGGRPYYQVLLGDALRANGQRAAARRAYRRAIRLRPGYRPALRRLQRRRAGRTRATVSSPS